MSSWSGGVGYLHVLSTRVVSLCEEIWPVATCRFIHIYPQDSTNLCFRGNLLLDRLSAERIIVAPPPPGLKIEEHIKILHQQTLQYTEKLR